MTGPVEHDLIELATPYALHAIPESDLDDIERRLADAPPEVVAPSTTRCAPCGRPWRCSRPARRSIRRQLRDRVLASWPTTPVRELRPKPRWQKAVLAAAAVLVIGLGALGVGYALRPAPTPSTAEQVFAAPDVRTMSGPIPTGGTATLVFSRDRNAGVLVMNNVAPPAPGTVYQMWLVGGGVAESAGTMDAKAVAPSTTAVLPDLGDSHALALHGRTGLRLRAPTTPVFAELPLV